MKPWRMAAAILVLVTTTVPKATARNATDTVRTSLWHTVAPGVPPDIPAAASTAMTVTSSRSRLDCVLACAVNATNPCVALVYGEVERSCLLFSRLELTDQSGGDAGKFEMIVNKANLCYATEADQHSDNREVVDIKQNSLISLEASVTCDDDYMASSDDAPKVNCHYGEWSKLNGTCLQRIWRNETAKVEIFYRIPHIPLPGWSVCFRGIFDGTERWAVNLRANEEDILFNMDSRYEYKQYANITYLNHRIDGVNGHSGADRPSVGGPDFPFRPYQPFNVSMVAMSSSEVHVLVGGKFYTNYTLPLPMSNLTMIGFKFQVRVMYLDLWCSP
ncbi:uncharacterized protein LOC143297399 [Babylonia areolata]|uniref:uncharacterized protein LOC143297399 n=1 Tax=Babylonia areolata TaxID=304850 RepID=UPI003FD49D34